MKEYVDKFSL